MTVPVLGVLPACRRAAAGGLLVQPWLLLMRCGCSHCRAAAAAVSVVAYAEAVSPQPCIALLVEASPCRWAGFESDSQAQLAGSALPPMQPSLVRRVPSVASIQPPLCSACVNRHACVGFYPDTRSTSSMHDIHAHRLSHVCCIRAATVPGKRLTSSGDTARPPMHPACRSPYRAYDNERVW